jgi:hypothetical protein
METNEEGWSKVGRKRVGKIGERTKMDRGKIGRENHPTKKENIQTQAPAFLEPQGKLYLRKKWKRKQFSK